MKHGAPIRPVATCVAYLCAGCVILLTVPLMMLLLLLLPERSCRKNKFLFGLLNLFYRGITFSILTPVVIEGRDLVPTSPAIFVGNHQSTLDVPLMGMLLNGRPHLWYALAYYARFPVLGFFIRRLGFSLDRGSSAGAAHGFLRGLRRLEKDPCNVLIFPEGARFVDGSVHEFLKGFALLARKTGMPVVPVFMPFNGRAYPPAAFWIRKQALLVVVGPLFELKPDEADEAFSERVHAWFVHQQGLLSR
ncbi:TPA: hypothetical protein DDZ86_05245 [Candidatus Dependentiae bacterium]|nr:hypothetical protein [Candidatus Dependentiae bacterium]